MIEEVRQMFRLHRRWQIIVLGAAIVVTLIFGVLPRVGPSGGNVQNGAVAYPTPAAAAFSTGGDAVMSAPHAAAAPTMASSVAQKSVADLGVAAPAAQPASAANWGLMVIRTATLSLQVTDVETALGKVRQIAAAGGGYVSASQTRYERVGNQDREIATVTIQVRSDAYDGTMQSLRQIATKVESETGATQDVSQEYVDNDSRLRNLQATETAILKLMDKAQSISDVLALQQQLTNVRGQIDQIQGRQQYLQRRSDMATITIDLHLPPLPGQQPQSNAWNPLQTAERGWNASLALLRDVADTLIVVVAFLWWLAIPLAIGYLVWSNRRARVSTPPA